MLHDCAVAGVHLSNECDLHLREIVYIGSVLVRAETRSNHFRTKFRKWLALTSISTPQSGNIPEVSCHCGSVDSGEPRAAKSGPTALLPRGVLPSWADTSGNLIRTVLHSNTYYLVLKHRDVQGI